MKQSDVIEKVMEELNKVSPDELADKVIEDMKAPFFSSEQFRDLNNNYHSVDEVLLVNEELQIQLNALKSRFCGCGNCINKDKPCSFLLSKNEAFCPDYVLEEDSLDIYEE